eukprot:1234641-Rhodomonas_salina.1
MRNAMRCAVLRCAMRCDVCGTEVRYAVRRAVLKCAMRQAMSELFNRPIEVYRSSAEPMKIFHEVPPSTLHPTPLILCRPLFLDP